MTKSSVSKDAKAYKTTEDNIVEFDDILLLDVNQKKKRIDLSSLRQNQYRNKGKIDEKRNEAVNLFVHTIKLELRHDASHSTVYVYVTELRKYFKFCDKNNTDPLSENSYRKYYIKLYGDVKSTDKFKQLWQYVSGEKLPFTETTATIRIKSLGICLKKMKIFQESWNEDLPELKKNRDNNYEPYSSAELDLMLKRITSYFSQLSKALIKSGDPTTPVKVIIDSKEIEIGNVRKSKTISYESPFNQAMLAAYYLFSYFSAMNSTLVVNIVHPIAKSSDSKSDRTSKWFKFEGFKRRSNKEIKAMIGGDVEQNFQIIKSGGEFIQQLINLSKRFCHEENNYLIYNLDEDGRVKKFSIEHSASNRLLCERLHLINKSIQAPVFYLLEVQKKLIQHKSFTKIQQDIETGIVVRTEHVIPYWLNRSIGISFVMLNAISHENVDFLSITQPVIMTPQEDKFIVSAKTLKGTEITFSFNKEYISIFEQVVYVSDLAYKLAKQESDEMKLLIPHVFIDKQMVKSFNGLSPIKHSRPLLILEYGVKMEHYFIRLINSKIRCSNVSIHRNRVDNSPTKIGIIIQNSEDVQLIHYSNENKETDYQILHQGLNVVEELAKTRNIDRAKTNVRSKLKIETLTIDEMANRKGHLTIAGTFCSGDNEGNINKIKKIAERSAILDKDYQLSCNLYDKCVSCKSCKLVKDVDAIYRLLSFVERLKNGEQYFTTRYLETTNVVIRKIKLSINANIPKEIIKAAKEKLETEGIHPYWK